MAQIVLRYLGFALPISILIGLFLSANAVYAADTRAPEAHLYTAKIISRLEKPKTFSVFDDGFAGGVRTALGDVNGDGVDELVVAAGPGGGPHVRILAQDGERLSSFFVYDESFRKGLYIATGDINGDGKDEIITGAASADGSEVKVFTMHGVLLENFYPYDGVFTGDVLVAAGDVDGDHRDEIVTGSGPGGSPHVRVFDGDGTWLGLDYFPYASWDRGGVAVAAADTNNDGKSEVITTILSGGPAIVKVYGYHVDRPIYSEFYAYPSSFKGGASLAAVDINTDGKAEIITGAGAGGGPQVRTFTADGTPKPAWTFAYELDFRGGIYVAASVDKESPHIITGPATRATFGEQGQRIVVDISEQRLYAYENGQQVNTFLISSGLPGASETPRGDFAISQKIPVKHYFGYFGPGNPSNFDLPGTKWNLRFDGPRLLHGAYWHNNFGHKMSHGCINIHYDNAEWIYNWAEIGTPVRVQD
ncbi:MAG: L,D-transpeptidase family protein [Patescibacteria group bacterium]